MSSSENFVKIWLDLAEILSLVLKLDQKTWTFPDPFVSGYLTISMLASLENSFLWWIFSVTALCKYKKYEMYVLLGLGLNLMINYTNNVWEPSWAQNLLLHMQTFYGRNHWQPILGASTGAMTAKEYRQDTFKILTIIGLTKLTKLTNPHYIYNIN